MFLSNVNKADNVFVECLSLYCCLTSFIEDCHPEELEELRMFCNLASTPSVLRTTKQNEQIVTATDTGLERCCVGVQVEVKAPLLGPQRKKADVLVELYDVTVVFELKRIRREDMNGNIVGLEPEVRASGEPAN